MATGHEDTRLDSWKAVAAYLGRDVSTVIRWEKEKGLPVHRVPGGKRQTIFALTSEIDAWLVSAAPANVSEPLPAPDPKLAAPLESATLSPAKRRTFRWVAAAAVAVAAAAPLTSLDTSDVPDGRESPFVRHDIAITSPYSAAATDFNGDGQLDLAVTGYRTNLLHLFEGRGDGTFHHLRSDATGIGPDGVAAGDFNLDGVVDVATANRGSDSISVLFGAGHGTFRPRVDLSAGEAPRGILATDLDGDGNIDLAAANFDAATVAVIRRQTGGFAEPEVYGVGTAPYQVRAADFNRDGLVDLVVGNTDEERLARPDDSATYTLAILLGIGDGRFEARSQHLLGRGSSGIAVAEFDGDGVLDLAVTSFEDHVVYLLTGVGDGTFRVSATLATGAAPLEIAAGDINGDAIVDLVTTNAHDKAVSVLRGRGDGTFEPRMDVPVNSYPKAVVLGDFNGDRKLDMVVTNFLDNSISVLLNTPSRLSRWTTVR